MNKLQKIIISIVIVIVVILCVVYAQGLQKQNYDLKQKNNIQECTKLTVEPEITVDVHSLNTNSLDINKLDINSDITNIVTSIDKIDNQIFIKVASEYPNIDIGFAYAIHRLETGNGTSPLWLQNNNAGGLKGKSGYYSYESQESGYRALFQLLNKYITEYNLKTPLEIGNLWCNEGWSYKTVEIWKEINNYE